MGAVKMRARHLARRVPDVVKTGCRQLHSLDQRNYALRRNRICRGLGPGRSADEATNLCRLPDRPGDKPALAYQRRKACLLQQKGSRSGEMPPCPASRDTAGLSTNSSFFASFRRKRSIIGARFCRAEASEARSPEQGKTTGTAIRGFKKSEGDASRARSDRAGGDRAVCATLSPRMIFRTPLTS